LRQAFLSFLSSRESHTLSLYFWYLLFSINDKTIKNKYFSVFCWDIIKCELFFIDGGCENTGYCCNHLKIKYDKKHMHTESQFDLMAAKHSVLKRFIPIKKENSDKISYFTCTSLNEKNTCNDYETRPNFCKNYPYNIFIQFDYIRKGCGYKIKLKREFFSRNEQLRKLIKKVYLLNEL
jgi:Fe-S-cluster containining protein